MLASCGCKGVARCLPKRAPPRPPSLSLPTGCLLDAALGLCMSGRFMFTTETIMFNLGRANQFFMLIMNQPGGPAASFTVLREQVHVLAWASGDICWGGSTSRRTPPWGPYLLGRECVRACVCE